MIGKLTNTVIYTPASLKAATAGQDRSASQTASPASSAATAGETTVSISTAARQQQAADAAKQAAQRDAAPENASAPSDSDDVLDITKEKAESFAYGALGMDHPDEVTSNTDEYYTAGQVLSALGTVATVLLAIA